MSIVVGLGSIILIAVVLHDGFEAMLLPRRVSRNWRFARVFFRATWTPWVALACRMKAGKRREYFLSLFGPLSMLVLFGVWALGLIAGFGLLHWSLRSPVHATIDSIGIFDYLYLSGVTFFTLGYGDVTPTDVTGRSLAVIESGIGFGFLAVVISYLPVLYQAFSQREHTISLLDARAGSPPTAEQLLIRVGQTRDFAALTRFLEEWERFAAVVLESHLSFPVLSFYRSQHDNQSWLAALTMVLDTCAMVLAGVRGIDPYQAQLTFAMARHAVVDVAQVLQTRPVPPEPDRLPDDRLHALRDGLRSAGFDVRDGAAADAQLTELRGMYEPFVNALAARLLLVLPSYVAGPGKVDNWQTSAWMRRTKGIGTLASIDVCDDHED